MAQEKQDDGRIGDFAQSLKEVARLPNALGCASTAKSITANRTAQLLEVRIGQTAKLRGEQAMCNVGLLTSAMHKQTSVSAHGDLATERGGSVLKLSEKP